MSAVEDRVRDHLRDQPLPGETEAAARAWPVVEAALAGRSPEPRRARVLPRLALAAVLAAGALLAALTPAGAWIKDRFEAEPQPGPPGFAALPDGRPVLAINRTGAYAVDSDGSSQHLGSFSEAGWSPRGKHVIGTDGRRLTAVTPTGVPKWTLVRRERVHHPAWSSGLGFAVAYLERSSLRVIAGNGDPATHRRLRRDAAPVTPAWLPGSDTVLAYATRGGRVETIDIATGATLSTARLRAAGIRALAWTAGGRRLVALSSHAVTVLNRRGRTLASIRLEGVARELALHPSGTRAAIAVRRGAETRVVEVRLSSGEPGAPNAGRAASRQLFQGDVDGLAWSADGRRLLLGWRGADQWLLLRRNGRVTPLHGVTRELGAAGGFPRVVDWCCGG